MPRTAFLALAAIALTSCARAADTHPATVLLIRHAEKPADDDPSPDLSPEGRKRAEALPKLFGKSAPFPTPDFLFATKTSRNSQRPLQTLQPLSEALKLPVNAKFANDDYAKLATELAKPKYAGKTVLVAWHHGTLPELAKALGVADGPDHWKGSKFDRVWQVSYDAAGKATLQDLPQRLMAGDGKK